MDNKTLYGMNCCLSSGLLTATGAETVHDTTVTIDYVLNGVIASKTAITDGATPTTDYVTGSGITLTASKARVVVWGLIDGGTVKVIAGDIVDWDGVAFKVAPPFPDIPDTFVPFATQLIKGASDVSGTWDFGVDNWSATGITSSIKNVMVLPSRPRTA
jgi:hypothetical protein